MLGGHAAPGQCKYPYGRRCSRGVMPGSDFCRYHQPRKPVPPELRCKDTTAWSPYTGGGNPCEYRALPGTSYCKIHTPGYVSERSKRATARMLAQFEKNDRRDKMADAAEKIIAVLKKIADGHNDPRTLAQETLREVL